MFQKQCIKTKIPNLLFPKVSPEKLEELFGLRSNTTPSDPVLSSRGIWRPATRFWFLPLVSPGSRIWPRDAISSPAHRVLHQPSHPPAAFTSGCAGRRSPCHGQVGSFMHSFIHSSLCFAFHCCSVYDLRHLCADNVSGVWVWRVTPAVDYYSIRLCI